MAERESFHRVRGRATGGGALAALLLAATGCGPWAIEGVQLVPAPSLPQRVELTYLGSGGWLIESGGQAMMTGLLLSNPHPLALMAGGMRVDSAMIDARLAHLSEPLSKVRSILVGHGHYDHLMDVPYVATAYAAPDATVYGSETVHLNVVDWGLPPERLHVVDDSVGDHARAGRWITDPGGRFRFQPVLSEHSPHGPFGFHLWKGNRENAAKAFPESAGDWPEGPTYAWLIDVLDDQRRPFFRIYYQDSGADPPLGHPAPSTAPPPDVPTLALLTAPGHRWVEAYPDSILSQLEPEFVLTSHWEDFLNSEASEPAEPVPLTFFLDWRKKMGAWREDGWWVPAPMSRWVFGAS